MKKLVFIALAIMIAVAACVPPGQINKERTPGHLKHGGHTGANVDGNVNVNLNFK